MIDKMEYLKRAQDYCAARNDENWFCEIYANYREWYSVVDAVFCALSWLYDEDTATMLKYKYCEVVL